MKQMFQSSHVLSEIDALPTANGPQRWIKCHDLDGSRNSAEFPTCFALCLDDISTAGVTYVLSHAECIAANANPAALRLRKRGKSGYNGATCLYLASVMDACLPWYGFLCSHVIVQVLWWPVKQPHHVPKEFVILHFASEGDQLKARFRNSLGRKWTTLRLPVPYFSPENDLLVNYICVQSY